MVDQQLPPAPPSSDPLPPWLRKPSGVPSQPSQPIPAPGDIPGPWSRPAPLKSANPTVPPAPNAPSSEAAKDWGPIKPIRTVPKPDEKRVAYILAQTEHVVNPDEEHARKKWIILGSIMAFLVIAGGTLAFVFFGRSTQTPKLDTNSVTIVNPRAKNGNASTNDVFPVANDNRNLNTNSAASVNQNANAAIVDTDADQDGISDDEEVALGTDTKKADTDGDGFSDEAELRNSYSPVGSGRVTVGYFMKYCVSAMQGIENLFTSSDNLKLCTKYTETVKAVLAVAPEKTQQTVEQEFGKREDAIVVWCDKEYPENTNDKLSSLRAIGCAMGFTYVATFFQAHKT